MALEAFAAAPLGPPGDRTGKRGSNRTACELRPKPGTSFSFAAMLRLP
jgi:hypothetical protein